MASPAVLLRSRSFRGASAFVVTTSDGVRLTGSRVGDAGPSVVFAHGFLGWHRKHRLVRFVEALAGPFSVYAVDLRGHGASEGRSTFGDREVLDVDAVVRLARRERPAEPLVALGLSMGGVAVVRHAAGVARLPQPERSDAVVAVSAPARWDGHGSVGVRRMRWIATTAPGRRVAEALGVRLADHEGWPEAPEDVVGRIAPIPLIVVHGRDDHVFNEEEAWRLYRRAGEPRRLMLASRFGHAEDGLSPPFAERLSARILEALAGR